MSSEDLDPVHGVVRANRTPRSRDSGVGTVPDRRLTRRRVRSSILADAIPMLVIGLALVSVYHLPTSVKTTLVFSYADPTLLTAFTAHFVHMSPAHLLGNLAGMVVLYVVSYGLFRAAGQRTVFLASVVTIVVVFPFVLSGLNLAVPRSGYLFGFSGLTMAFLGLVPLGLTAFATRAFSTTLQLEDAIPLFLGSLVLIVWVLLPRSGIQLALLLTATVGMFGLLGASSRRFLHAGWIGLRRLRHRPIAAMGYFLVVAIWVGYLLLGFPAEPVTTGAVINVYVHFLGYALGFIVPTMTTLLLRTSAVPTDPLGHARSTDSPVVYLD